MLYARGMKVAMNSQLSGDLRFRKSKKSEIPCLHIRGGISLARQSGIAKGSYLSRKAVVKVWPINENAAENWEHAN